MSILFQLPCAEYHGPVRRSILSTAVFFVPLIAAGFCAAVQAQITGAPPSVTSSGFGGHAANAPAASVTSLGPHGYAPNSPAPSNQNGEHRHHGGGDNSGAAVLYAFPVPYAPYDEGAVNDNQANDQAAAAAQDDAEHQGGPTIFDRRGSGADSYIPPVTDMPRPHAAPLAAPSADAVPAPATVLVFKDGHTVEAVNYAIVGTTLFDLTPGHSRRVPLADLDLDATRKKNDDRGVTFDLPPSLQGS